jgi:hypothetical protein
VPELAPVPTPAPPKPSAAAAAAGSGDADQAGKPKIGGDDEAGEGRSRRYGGAGLPRGVEHLAKAFTWYLPSAVASHQAWRELPLGEVGVIEVTLRVNALGKVTGAVFDKQAPEPMRAIITRTMALVQSGRFSLAENRRLAGHETLRIAVTLSQAQPHPDLGKDGREPHHVFNYGRDLPAMGQSGRAYFTQLSGRHFESRISIMASVPDVAPDAGADDN